VRPSRSRPEFFLDRSLGGRDVAAALRRAGWIVRTHHEVYGDRDQEVEDVEWLELCGRQGWPALTMDRRIRYRSAEIAAVRRYRVRLFALTSGNLTAADQAQRFIRNAARIEAACEHPGPFMYAVHADRIVRIFAR
jgi:hypothetical protein